MGNLKVRTLQLADKRYEIQLLEAKLGQNQP